jgi:hypothetical protein
MSLQLSADGPFEGRVDGLTDGILQGWVWNRDRPSDHVMVGIISSLGQKLTVLADRPRNDLLAANIGKGDHGFSADLSKWKLVDVVIIVQVAGHAELPIGKIVCSTIAEEIATRPGHDMYATLLSSQILSVIGG